MLYAYKLFLKFSSKYIHPNYFFYCFECFHRVCPNLSSAPCRSCHSPSTHKPPASWASAPKGGVFRAGFYTNIFMNRSSPISSGWGGGKGGESEGENKRGVGVEGLKPLCEGDGGMRWQWGEKTFLPSKIFLPHCQPTPLSPSHIGLSHSTLHPF
jgi:hypothetical protein